MAEFKRGDRVKILDSNRSPIPVGDFGKVRDIDSRENITVATELAYGRWPKGEVWLFRPKCLELVTPAEPVRPTRKIVQLTAVSGYGPYALCDDGTAWEMVGGVVSDKRWSQLPPIPQPEPTP